MQKRSVLVVDDDIITWQIIRGTLQDVFDLRHADSGQACMAAVATALPDIILMDIELGDASGYDLCQKLRDSPLDEQPYIVFVSGHGNNEERLAAYMAGGDDFITKPLSLPEFKAKMQLVAENLDTLGRLRVTADNAMTVAMTVMSEQSALGIVLNFFRALSSHPGIDDIVDKALQALHDFGLQGVIQIRLESGITTLNTERRASPMESILLQGLSSEPAHVIDYGSRSVFHYGPVSLLVRNMPVDNPEQVGKLKDCLAILTEGAASMASALEVQRIAQAMQTVSAASGTDEFDFILSDIQADLLEASHEMLLSPSQEDTLLDIMRKARLRLRTARQGSTGPSSPEDMGRLLDSLIRVSGH